MTLGHERRRLRFAVPGIRNAKARDDAFVPCLLHGLRHGRSNGSNRSRPVSGLLSALPVCAGDQLSRKPIAGFLAPAVLDRTRLSEIVSDLFLFPSDVPEDVQK